MAKQEKKHSRRKRILRRVAKLCLAFVILIGVLTAALFVMKSRIAVEITMTQKPCEMLQEQELPRGEWEASVNDEKYQDVPLKLTTEERYFIHDLMSEMESGRYIDTSCDGDLNIEGTYDVTAALSKEFEEIPNQFGIKMKVNLVPSKVTVKNKLGEWDGDKFRTWDGSYASEAFINIDGEVYYFGVDEKKVTGKFNVDGDEYYFDENGVRQHGFVDIKGKTYYFNDMGVMQYGWLEVAGNTYYLLEDGHAAKGKARIGYRTCYFGEDGILKSEEDSVDPKKPMIALTFDDGPGADTNKLLDVLEEYGVHATFFLLGENLEGKEKIVKRMETLGCEIGNHTWDHPELTKKSAEEVKSEVKKTGDAIKKITGSAPTVLRPPYGDYNSEVLKAADMPAILWSIDTLDWKTKSKEETVKSILLAEDGEIVLLHDSHSWSVDAAIEAIPKLIEEGFQLVTVSEMAEVRHGGLTKGEHYSQFYPKERDPKKVAAKKAAEKEAAEKEAKEKAAKEKAAAEKATTEKKSDAKEQTADKTKESADKKKE